MIPGSLALAAACVGAALLLVAVGQPIFTDDAWWHLALGRHFAAEGPWLAADPLLVAPVSAPSPASWLIDVALHGVVEVFGFTGLRVLHVAVVAALLVAVGALVRRTNGSTPVAAAAVLAFVALAAYRVFQLRPELASIACALALYAIAIAPGGTPSWRRVAATTALAALWANLHAGFLLAPMLLAAAAAGAALVDGPRARRLAVAAALGGLATFANPLGPQAHLAYFVAGAETPALAFVADEWARFPLLAGPRPGLPPSWLAWGLTWALGLALLAALPGMWRRRDRIDPARFAVAALAYAMMLAAVRFSWLGVFVLFAVAQRWRAPDDRRVAWGAALAAVALVGAFVRLGDWPVISRGMPRSADGYAKAYPAGKYCSHALWLLRDAGLRGNLYTDYYVGGFANYWLAPEVRTLVNGTLNFSKETFVAFDAIGKRRGATPDELFAEMLDRIGLDLFLGHRLPAQSPSERPWRSTTAHPEGAPGWLPIYRSPLCSLWLRTNERNAENLERITRHYADAGVPFDAERGFLVPRTVREAPAWAIEHGVVPKHIAQIEIAVLRNGEGARGNRDRLAALYATLGAYERAVRLDRATLREAPNALHARRRLVWSLLRLGRYEAAAREAEWLAERPPSDRLSQRIARVAFAAADMRPDLARAAISRLPFLAASDIAPMKRGLVPPEARPAR